MNRDDDSPALQDDSPASQDEKAQAVLDLLMDIARCPGCGEVGSWVHLYREKAGRCRTPLRFCKVLYFRSDHMVILVGDEHSDGAASFSSWSPLPLRLNKK